MLLREGFICTSCGKVNYGGSVWSEIDDDVPSNLVKVLCPGCSHERFPQFYSDYEKPKESFGEKILKGFSRQNKKS
jgi:hypothetical protein